MRSYPALNATSCSAAAAPTQTILPPSDPPMLTGARLMRTLHLTCITYSSGGAYYNMWDDIQYLPLRNPYILLDDGEYPHCFMGHRKISLFDNLVCVTRRWIVLILFLVVAFCDRHFLLHAYGCMHQVEYFRFSLSLTRVNIEERFSE